MSSQFANSKEISNVNRTLSNALTAMQVTEPWLQQKHVIYGKQQIKEGEIKRVFITWRKWYWWYNSIADECFNFFFLGNISQTTKRFSQWTLLMLTLFIFYKALSWSWSYHLDIFFSFLASAPNWYNICHLSFGTRKSEVPRHWYLYPWTLSEGLTFFLLY